MKTRSAYIKPPWQFEIRSVDLPDAPPPGHLLLRIESCGICGSDVLSAEAGGGDWHPFGHEIAGLIEAVGDGMTRLSPGQRVVLESCTFCGRCDLCRNGRVDLCRGGPRFQRQPAWGFSERMIAPADCAVAYEGLAPESACLSEPGGVAYDMVRVAEVRLGDRVCVVGPGPIGLMAAAIARVAGARKLTCIGRGHSVRRLELAEQLGARAVACDGPLDQLAELAGQFDHVLLTAPTRFIPEAFSLLAYGGRLTYVGLGGGQPTIAFDADAFHVRKLQLRASYAAPGIFLPAVLQLLADGVIPGDKLVSHRFALSDIAQAMRTARDDKPAAVKVVVVPEGKNG